MFNKFSLDHYYAKIIERKIIDKVNVYENKNNFWYDGENGVEENKSLRGSARVHESLWNMSTRIKDQLVLAGSPPLNKNPHLAVFSEILKYFMLIFLFYFRFCNKIFLLK